jgi:hypothetical protein
MAFKFFGACFYYWIMPKLRKYWIEYMPRVHFEHPNRNSIKLAPIGDIERPYPVAPAMAYEAYDDELFD